MALVYLDPNRHRLNLTVKANVQALKIMFSGQRAIGVEMESGGEFFSLEGDEIILCAGAVASPHLLMLSGLGPADHLEEFGIPVISDLPGVGQNMRDHPNVTVKFTVKEGTYDDPNGMRALRLRFSATGTQTPNDMILSPASMNTVVNEGDDPNHTINCGLYLAVGKGEIRLDSADPHARPRMDYHYLEEPWDRERLREAVRKCVGLLKDPAYSEIIEERTAPLDADLVSDETLDDWLLRNVSSSFHISGTCKMGPDSDLDAVVDQRLKVRGVEGLRVVDASVMPDVVRANTNVTTMMIAERASDFIKQGS
jgi:choline dehydrogenase